MSFKKEESDFEEKVLFVNRCSKVVKGGRKFSFSALVVVGDCKGQVGYGFAKANELTDAIKKAGESARNSLITFEMEGTTIPHEVLVEYDGAKLLFKPAAEGAGVIAGSTMRTILKQAGVKDIVVKSIGANNPINQVKATFKALSQLRSRKQVMEMRGLSS